MVAACCTGKRKKCVSPLRHAIQRHGEAVTDAQLIERATTGWVDDAGRHLHVPWLSSAFTSDRFLVEAELRARAMLPRAEAFLKTHDTRVAIRVQMGQVVGRGYTAATAGAAPSRIGGLTIAEVRFRYDFRSATWKTATVFPTNLW